MEVRKTVHRNRTCSRTRPVCLCSRPDESTKGFVFSSLPLKDLSRGMIHDTQFMKRVHVQRGYDYDHCDHDGMDGPFEFVGTGGPLIRHDTTRHERGAD